MANNQVYDILILGAGVAGAFAAYNLSKSIDRKTKVGIVEFGRPPGKRRKQLEGWFGCFPSSNSRIYVDNLETINDACGIKPTKKANEAVMELFEQYGSTKIVKTKEVNDSLKTKLDKNNFAIKYNNYIQWKTEDIHKLSKVMADKIIDDQKIKMSFDNEVYSVKLNKDKIFEIHTELGVIKSKKLINCLGRSGWRLSKKIYESLGMELLNDYAYFGFRGEINASQVKDWNQSHCTVSKDNLIVGPLSWKGTIIPEDHYDVVICSWRSNEDRWLSEKVAFSVLVKQEFKNKGIEQTERLASLGYVLSDNRVGKIRIKEFLSQHNDLKLLPEYDWLSDKMQEVQKIMPNFIEKSYMHIPDIITNPKLININKNLSTEIDGLYTCGESGGFNGIYSAALTGTIAATSIMKR